MMGEAEIGKSRLCYADWSLKTLIVGLFKLS
jgi:hypothetical protein